MEKIGLEQLKPYLVVSTGARLEIEQEMENGITQL
jgi:hypothetical protein